MQGGGKERKYIKPHVLKESGESVAYFSNSILSWLMSIPAISGPGGNTFFSHMSVSLSQILNIASRKLVVMTKQGKVV